MNDHRPRIIIRILIATAVLGFLGSALLDANEDWGNPRQALANICWILFLLSVIALIVAGGRLLLLRRRQTSST